jgi:hypothetical protein
MDISKYVGDPSKISLWAFVTTSPHTWTTNPLCVLDIMYDGESKRRWEFGENGGCEISR